MNTESFKTMAKEFRQHYDELLNMWSNGLPHSSYEFLRETVRPHIEMFMSDQHYQQCTQCFLAYAKLVMGYDNKNVYLHNFKQLLDEVEFYANGMSVF